MRNLIATVAHRQHFTISNIPEIAQKTIVEHRIDASQKIQFRSLDLSSNFADVEKCFAELETTVGAVYALINCAGTAICGTFESMSIEDARKMIDINFWATYYPTRCVIPKMKAAGEGIVTITGSQLSLLGIYGYSAYAAAKFALRGLAESIAMEVAHKGVSVTLALPADTGELFGTSTIERSGHRLLCFRYTGIRHGGTHQTKGDQNHFQRWRFSQTGGSWSTDPRGLPQGIIHFDQRLRELDDHHHVFWYVPLGIIAFQSVAGLPHGAIEAGWLRGSMALPQGHQGLPNDRNQGKNQLIYKFFFLSKTYFIFLF